MSNKIEGFISACDDLITCKYLVAEYKIQKMLKELSKCEEACTLIGDCLEQFNREREFAKAYVQNSYGEFVCVMPTEEYKIISLVFCTLVDIENKKIDFTDFVRRFFGGDDSSFQKFIQTMVIPFRNLLAEAFGYPKIESTEKVASVQDNNEEDEVDENVDEFEGYEEGTDLELSDEQGDDDEFEEAEKLAVTILSELQYARRDYDTLAVEKICRAIIKTAPMKDREVTSALACALKCYKVKQVKFIVKELYDMFE